MLEVASLRYGVIFKKAFSQPHIFKGFIRDITGIDLQIDRVETEKTFDKPVGRIQSRFDLFAEDEHNRIIVDIQHARLPDHYHRFLHYHCAAVIEQAASAKHYVPKMRVLTVVVLTSSEYHNIDVASIDFDPKDVHGKGIGEIFHQVLYLNSASANAHTHEPYRQWLLAIQDSLDEKVDESLYSNQTIQEVFKIIAQSLVSPEDMARMKDEAAYEELQHEKLTEALEQGLARGKQEGILEGMQKGKQEGNLEGRLLVARNLLDVIGDDLLLAAKTGLDVEVVRALRAGEFA